MSAAMFMVALFVMNFGFAAHAADKVVQIAAGDNFEGRLQEALIMAEPGTTIEIGPGHFDMTGGLSIDVQGITLKGAGMDQTVFSYKGQTNGGEGLLVTSDGVRLEGFAIEDTPGDGIKTKGVDTVSMIGVRVEWTGGPSPNNGSYGLYPVQSKNVLIDGAVVKGASDAGIYVGQSQHIIVRNSRAEYNVAGIEIENCYFADVHDNVATHNTGGILAFDMPNLPQMGGHSIRIYHNRSVDNDTANFAPEGNIVGTVPMGTGIMVMANRDVEIFDNDIGGNATTNVLLASYPRDFTDPTYIPMPRRIYIHDNRYGKAGYAPDKLAKTLIEPKTGLPLPDIIWDGVVNSFWAALFGPSAEDGIRIHEKKGTTFVNLQMAKDHVLPWGASPDFDIEDYGGSFPGRAAVKLPQDQDAGAAGASASAPSGSQSASRSDSRSDSQ
ncbi:right-handed parallel beta-helix repeat-containing protein [Kordiimonas sp. A6E486]|nr:right-handed parallel beta-helix repeat-containing protein [Kordiimonas marina]